MGSRVTRESNGTLVVTSGDTMRVIDARSGGTPTVTEYNYDRSGKTLTVKSGRGNMTIIHANNTYVAENGDNASGHRTIQLPSAVANMIGARRAVAVENDGVFSIPA